MVIGSHNSWSFLRSKKWWMKLFRWSARCQDVDIREQYSLYNVNCFDLRIKFNKKGELLVSHNKYICDITERELREDLKFLNEQGECYVRVINDVRSESEATPTNKYNFIMFCKEIEKHYQYIKFWCGRNMYDWSVDYDFAGVEPTCCERYGSVAKPKWLNGLYPRKYAKKHNRTIVEDGTTKDILLIDFVNLK